MGRSPRTPNYLWEESRFTLRYQRITENHPLLLAFQTILSSSPLFLSNSIKFYKKNSPQLPFPKHQRHVIWAQIHGHGTEKRIHEIRVVRLVSEKMWEKKKEQKKITKKKKSCNLQKSLLCDLDADWITA